MCAAGACKANSFQINFLLARAIMNVVDWLWISDQEIKEGTELLNILPTQHSLLGIQPEANLYVNIIFINKRRF